MRSSARACPSCGGLFARKTWRHDHPASLRLYDRVVWRACPACRQAQLGEGLGKVVIENVAAGEGEALIRRRIANVAARARLTQPQRRVVDIGRVGEALEVLTTSQKLAHRVARELENLLSSRAPPAADALDRRRRTTVDYGVPDLSFFTLDGHGTVEMARHIGDAILAYEPRLANTRVTVERDPSRRDRAIARIEGSIVLGPVMEPVIFRLPLGGNGTGTSDGG